MLVKVCVLVLAKFMETMLREVKKVDASDRALLIMYQNILAMQSGLLE